MRGRRRVEHRVLVQASPELQRIELASGPLAERACQDGTIVKLQQGGACALSKGVPGDRPFAWGLTTTFHAIVWDNRLPLVIALTTGQSGDAPRGRNLLEQLGPQLTGGSSSTSPRPPRLTCQRLGRALHQQT